MLNNIFFILKKNHITSLNKQIYFKIGFELYKVVPYFIHKIIIKRDEFLIYCIEWNFLYLLFFFKYHLNTQQKLLTDITVVDYINKKYNFLLVYNFLSVVYNFRIIIKFFMNSFYNLASISYLYLAANWFEREIWDLFGIFIINSFDLRRILTDYGFEGHPLLKIFPVIGYYELRYEQGIKKILKEPIELNQEYRTFNLINSW